jgi:hypothetical protein
VRQRAGTYRPLIGIAGAVTDRPGLHQVVDLAAYAAVVKRLVVAALTLIFVSVLVVVYMATGWHRMEYECATARAMGENKSVSFSWSWSPFGFRCEYPDGTRMTELWY